MKIHYEVSFLEPQTHLFQVKMTLDNIDKDIIEVSMPVWTPGSYLLREYAQHIDQFDVLNSKGKVVEFDKTDKNSWRIEIGDESQIDIIYRIYAFEATVRTNFVDTDHASLNGACTFLYVKDEQDLPSTIEFKPYKDWKKIACALPTKGNNKWIRKAVNFDEIVDSPVEIGNHEEYNFKAAGIPHTVAIQGASNGDNAQFVKDIEHVCEVAISVFGDSPCKNYTFIINNTENRYNGLEHLNSTVCQVPRWDYYPEEKYKRTMGLISHEYFHLWNVKRIRPEALGPFNYDAENYTKQLWVVEGVTSYFDDYILYLAGVFSEEEYLKVISKTLSGVVNSPANEVQSLTESSHDAWIKFYRKNENSMNNQVSYYTKGAMVVLALNFLIMHETDGEKNFGDFMKILWEDYKVNPERGYTEAQVLNTMEELSGVGLDDFFQRHIYGKEPVDFKKYFGYVGLELVDENEEEVEPSLGMVTKWVNGRLMVTSLNREYGAYQNGLNVNDEIIAIDDYRVFEGYKKIIAQKKVGDTLKVLVDRGGLVRVLELELNASKKIKYDIIAKKRPGKAARKLRDLWLVNNSL